MKNGKVAALYFDLNADGKLTSNERLLPAFSENRAGTRQTEFVTPDFSLKAPDGAKVPFRVLLQANLYGSDTRPNCMWSPSCVLEGVAQFQGEPHKLILYSDGFSGAFDQFGSASFSLLPNRRETNQYVPREILSSVINFQGKFYRLQLQGRHAENQTMRAVLSPDTRPIGEVAIHLQGVAPLASRLVYANVQGVQETTVHFTLPEGQTRLPVGEYRFDRGQVDYEAVGARNTQNWAVEFTQGPKAGVSAESPCQVQLGEPVLTVHAINDNQRYMPDAKESARYPKGATIYLSPQVKGKYGEVYNRFSLVTKSTRSRQDKPPQITIKNANGKAIVSKNLEYG